MERDVTERDNEFDGRPGLLKKRAAAIILQRLAITVVGIFIVSTLAIITANAVVSYNTRDQLVDCIDPDGQCYKDGQDRTTEFINGLIKSNRLTAKETQHIIVLAAACADQPGQDSISDIEKCVNDQLAEEKGGQ